MASRYPQKVLINNIFILEEATTRLWKGVEMVVAPVALQDSREMSVAVEGKFQADAEVSFTKMTMQYIT